MMTRVWGESPSRIRYSCYIRYAIVTYAWGESERPYSTHCSGCAPLVVTEATSAPERNRSIVTFACPCHAAWCSAVAPLPSAAPTDAPASSRARTVGTCPRPEARCNGRVPVPSALSTPAPAASRPGTASNA